jgi:hypothetical protein
MPRTIGEIIGGTIGAIAAFSCCVLIIGQLCVLCMVKKFAYATLIGMPVGCFAGIILVDRILYISKEFTVVGMLFGLIFTMLFLLAGIYLVALAPVTFFVFPLLISLCCVWGLKIGITIYRRRHGID